MNHENLSTSSSHQSNTMKRNNKHGLGLAVWTLALGLAFGASGCFDQLARVNRVQTNLIDKSVFEGEWWFMRTVIDMDDDAAYAVQGTGTFSPWPGAMADYDLASNSGVMGRIRWVIDENFIYAYRSTEVIVGSNPDARDDDFRGSPLAVYRILGHVDVRQEFNPGTGEPTNVVSESRDRRWYDRQFVRVDWSQNLVTFGLLGASLEIDQLFGAWRREPIPLGITDEGNEDLPAAWRPQFVRIGEDPDYRFFDEWPSDQMDAVHYMSFVTRDMWTPLSCFGGTCGTSIVITMRDAFLRIPPEHEYAAEVLANSEYDRFGILRTESRTYVRGGLERDTLGQFCNYDADCLSNACNETTHLCTGGLTDELGETDLLTYYRLRHNFYSDSLSDQECSTDWECSERALLDTDGDGVGDTSYDVDGDGVRAGGSVCDPAARRCTIPIRNRPIRRVEYFTSPGHPVYLFRSSFQLFAQWNEAFMTGHRGLSGLPPASGASVDCQDTNPTDYCYCGATMRAAEVRADNTCAWRQNYFMTPAENEARGGENVFDCYVAGAGDAAVSTFDIEHPDSFADYDPAVWGQLHFVGDECMLVLNVNSCDADPSAECEQLGDIRYNMFNYIDAPADFCGVMQAVQDPTNGEAIVSPVNMAGRCIDGNFGGPLYTWPILRGEEPEGVDGYINGDELRDYMEARGRVHPAEGFAPGADPGRIDEAGARPTLPVDLHGVFAEGLEAALARGVDSLHGEEGRRLIMSDRIHNAAGSDLEERLAGAMAAEGFVSVHPEEATAAAFLDTAAVRRDVDLDDEATLDRLSPFRDAFVDEMTLDARRDQLLMERGICIVRERAALTFSSQYGEYWAEAFRGFSREEAHLRWNQAWHRAVMQHELGHGLGLEHNFGGTLDRDNYQPEWFNIEFPASAGGRDGNALPRAIEFDTNGDAELTTTEWEAYRVALENARELRNGAGAGNYMTSSTMDYPGDLSDQMGIGPYDRGAIYYNYFGEVEALENSFAAPALTNEPTSTRHRILRTDNHTHRLMTFYRGGESCRVDAECPYSAASGALVSRDLDGDGVADESPIYQRCVTNPRFTSIPAPCAGGEHCICSSFDSDFDDFVSNIPGTGYVSDRDGDGATDIVPIRYLFGSNPRVNDISWCSWFDAGESFVETINFYRQQFQDTYLLSYFRRFRRGFGAQNVSYRYVINATKVYQHLLFRAIYEPGFFTDTSPVGFDDQYQASIAAMNWLVELATMPDVGSYDLDARTNSYDRLGEELTGGEIALEPGMGFHHWSRFQEGEVGFFRLERSGVMWDKLRALQALTIRDWGFSFTIDERYYINFYDFFPTEMTELFGGFILDDSSWYAPRVVNTSPVEIEYPNWYVANGLLGPQCNAPGTGEDVPCRGRIRDEYTDPVVEGTSNDVLRTYAAVFALSEFPVFYDTSWERRLAIFTLDNGDGFAIPDRQPDGSTTCGYGPVLTDPDHTTCATPDDADYITYQSDRVHTTYVAVRVRTSINAPRLEEDQLGFEFLQGLTVVSDRIAELTDGDPMNGEGGAELEALEERRVHDESFLVTLIELQRAFGITSWL